MIHVIASGLRLRNDKSVFFGMNKKQINYPDHIPVLRGLWFNGDMLENLELFFEQECTGLRLDLIMVGVSGGPDSLCLLDLLVKTGKPLVVAHFDHQLRPESGREAQHVQELARRYGLPFVSDSQDVRSFAEENGFSLEEAARKLRYRFLFDRARSAGVQVIAVAHHADDQVETVLMHFLRGAGLSGLKGMAAVTLLPEFDPAIRLIRPLLRNWRSEIEAYCQEHKLETVDDRSNLDETYFRNRLRHRLIPELETYNPGFKQTLLHTAASLGGDFDLVAEVVNGFWARSVQENGSGYLAFDLSALRTASTALLRNLFRRAASYLNSDLRDVNFESVERLVRFIRHGDLASKDVDFTDGNHAFMEDDRLFIASRAIEIPSPYWPRITQPVELMVGQPLHLQDDWRFLVQEELGMPDLEAIHANTNSFQAWLDADTVKGQLQVRSRRGGDRFQPLGMPDGSLKLSDFFINEKMPARARTNWPLVCLEGEIIWVPGYRSAHRSRVTTATRRLVHISLLKSKN